MVRKWSIYWVSLDPVSGSEQAGVRPALVISNDIVNEVLLVVTVVPLSSMKKDTRIYPTEVYLPMDLSALPKDSIAMVHQIRTISKKRMGNQCGMINDEDIKNSINTTIKNYFEV
jgi:mRNA interferase MazF